MSERKWSIVEKKKPTASWLGAGVRVRKGAVLQQIAKNNAVTLTEITQNTLNKTKTVPKDATNISPLETNLPYLELDMLCKSPVLVLVQDNTLSSNMPGGNSSSHRLAPPSMFMSKNKFRKSRNKILKHIDLLVSILLLTFFT